MIKFKTIFATIVGIIALGCIETSVLTSLVFMSVLLYLYKTQIKQIYEELNWKHSHLYIEMNL